MLKAEGRKKNRKEKKRVSEENKENIQRIREGRQKKNFKRKIKIESDKLLRKKKIVKTKFSYLNKFYFFNE